jgi:hypothetical protein
VHLTLRQRYDLGHDADVVADDLLRPEAWDALRASGNDAFRLAGTREELEQRAAADLLLRKRARAVAKAVR